MLEFGSCSSIGPVAQESVVDSALLRSIFRPFKTAILYTSCTQNSSYLLARIAPPKTRAGVGCRPDREYPRLTKWSGFPSYRGGQKADHAGKRLGKASAARSPRVAYLRDFSVIRCPPGRDSFDY